MFTHKWVSLLIVFLIFEEILCICQESHVIICDELQDVKKNETEGWRHLQLGTFDPNRVSFEPLKSQLTFSMGKVKSLTIINRINHIQTPISLGLHSLENLNLYGNNIIEIEDYTFTKLKKLKDADLENNKIQHLGQAIFKNLTLETVSLSRNKISSITTCFYESKIRWILLNHNKISYIKPRSFPRTLEQLELSDNQLESLDENAFENLRNLKELFLESNHFTSIPNIIQLTALQYLHFANNKIEYINYNFDQNPNVEFLDFSSNSLRNFSTVGFTGKKTPPVVVLNFNRLTNIVFDDPAKKTDLVLYGNPWNCNCLFQIEKIIQDYHHAKTCEVKYFDNGKVPLCIESGKCAGVISVANSDIESFYNLIRSVERNVTDYCKFRL